MVWYFYNLRKDIKKDPMKGKFKHNFKKFSFLKGPKSGLLFIAFFVLCLFALTKLTDYTRNVRHISYSTFIQDVELGKVASVTISGQDAEGVFKDGTRFETVIAQTDHNWDILKKQGVEFSVVIPSGFTMWHAILLGIAAMLMFVFFQFIRQMRNIGGGSGGSSNIFNIGKSKAKMFLPSSIKVTFDDVAGAQEAKEELQDVIDFLKSPKKYCRLGAKITRGILLIGEPGNGKTLLARAVAGEANCPFFSISGSDFIEVFVGVGASRVRDLFKQARKHTPCIVFIDEIDAVGRHRGNGIGGGNDEREQTLNQLLSEMDGFETEGGDVIVLAATNRPDVLDKALLRPGRFDRCVYVPYPDLKSREHILEVHARNVKMDSSIDIHKLARSTPGFTGADLANLINEAAIIASKNLKRKRIIMEDFEQARDKITLGKENRTKILTDHERQVTAYHEAGHALTRLLIPKHTDPLHKVTIIPRGRALGVTHWLPERDKYIETKDQMLASITSAMGGRAAELLVFNELGTGAYSDFNVATDLVRRMVCNYGMTDELGPVIYETKNRNFQYSEKTAEKIDAVMQRILETCMKKATNLLKINREKLDALAQALLDKETMYASEIYPLLGIEPREDFKLT